MPNLKEDAATKSPLLAGSNASPNSRTPIVVAVIASVTSIAGLLLTYVFTERARTEIASQTLQLERIKTDISAASQRTADVVARVDEARLQLERQIARSTELIESRKIQIDDRRGNTEEVRLTPDLTKLSNDLRPNFEVSCSGDALDGLVLRINCTFKNKGSHRALISPKFFTMLNRSDQKGLPGVIEKIENGVANNVLPNGSGSNTYEVWLTPAGAAVKSPIVSITFEAKTDDVAIALTKRLSKGAITNQELRELAMQGYTFNLRY